MADEMTLDQQKAIAMANARLRLQSQQPAPANEPTDQHGSLIDFGKAGDLVGNLPVVKDIQGRLGPDVEAARNSAFDQLKQDWHTANPDAALYKNAGAMERLKMIFNSHVAFGKLPYDAFQAALGASGITGLLNATVFDPAAAGLQAAHHAIGADVPLDVEKQSIINALWALGSEKGPMRGGFPAVAAPVQAEVKAGQAALATQKTGDVSAVKDAGHIADNLATAWAHTGEDPLSLTQRAQRDPVLREQLTGKQPETPPEGSSVTPTDHGDFVVPMTEEDKTRLASAFANKNAREEDQLNAIRDQMQVVRDVAGKLTNEKYRPLKTGQLPDNAFEGLKATEEEMAKFRGENPEAAAEAPERAHGQLEGRIGGPEGKLPPDAFDKLKEFPFDKEKSVAENLDAANKWASELPPPQSLEEAESRIILVQPKRPSFSIEKVGQTLYEELFDEKAPLKRAMAEARAGKPLPSEFVRDPETLERLTTGSKGRAKYSFETAQVNELGDLVGPSFKDIIAPVAKGEDFVQFEKFITAVSAEDWHAKGLETGLDPASTKVMANDPGLKAKYGPVLDKLVAWRNNEIHMMNAAGFIRDVNKLIAEIPHPIPLQREIEGQGQKAGAKGTYQPIKARKGSKLPIYSPIEQIMRQSLVRHDLAAHSIANNMIADELELAGMAHKGGTTRAIELTQGEIDRIASATGGQDAEGFDQTIFRHFNYPLREDELPTFRAGKMVPYRFDDPDVAKILRGQGRNSAAVFTKIMRGIAAVQRAGIVLDPTFSVRQVFYDVPFQFIVSDGIRNTLAEFISGVYHGLAGTPMDDLYRRSGAWRPLFHEINDKYIRNQVAKNYDQVGLFTGIRNIVNSPIRALQAWAQTIYTAQRRGRFIAETKANLAKGDQIQALGKKAYDAAIKKGQSPEKAQAAQRAAVNEANQAERERATKSAMNATFHTDERGSWSREINLIQPFFSADLNSVNRAAQAFDIFHNLAKGAVNISKAIAVITVPAILDHLAFRGQDWYDNADEYKKDMGLLLPPLHKGEDPIFIPQTPLLRTIFGGIPRRIIELELEHNPAAFKGFAGDLLKEAIPYQATYNAALPFVENMANYSFFRGRPLYSGPKVSAPYQYTNYTSGLAKDIARGLSSVPLLKDFNLTPWQIDNLFVGEGGALMQKFANTVAPSEYKQKVEQTWADSPWIGGFFLRYPSATAQPIMDYYDKRDEFQQAHGDIEKALTENNMPLFRQLAAENPVAASGRFRPNRNERPNELPQYLQVLRTNRQAGVIPALRAFQRIDKRMTVLRQTEAKLIHDDSVTPHDKRQLIDQIYGEMVVNSKLGSMILDEVGK